MPAFDALLFDLDGTLVATDRFWVQAARTGARRAFEALDLERELPSSADWMRLVGLPLEAGFDTLFADLTKEQRDTIRAACVEEEHRLLDAGGAALMPGAERSLDALARSGVRMAVASNCSQAYLDHMWKALGLERWMEAGLCLDSPGIGDKADMLEALLDRFETRSAVMIGDRATDGLAARANGLPFVFCRFGFAPGGEGVEAAAVIEDFSELAGVLDERHRGLAKVLEECGARRETFVPPSILGVAGAPGSGATLFARDLARQLGADFVSLDMFQNPTSEAPLALDFDRIERELFEPRSRGERVRLTGTVTDAGGVPSDLELVARPDRLLVVESPALLDPRLSARTDRLVVTQAEEGESLSRIAGRDARRYGPSSLEALRGRFRAWCGLIEPGALARIADLVVDLTNPLAPVIATA